MKAVALTALRTMQCLELAKPVIRKDNEVLVKVEKVGICGSDVHYFEDGRIGARAVEYPFVVGHECGGTVVEVGRSVHRVRVGDRLAIDPAMPCQRCDQCRQGRPHTCRHLAFLGSPGEAPGSLCEYIVMPEDSLFPLPPNLSLEEAVLCEPLSIAVYAVKQSSVLPCQRVAILGSGPIGLCVLQAARCAGTDRVYMTDRVPERVVKARQTGATWAGNPEQVDIVKTILDQEPDGLDVVYECAGQAATLDQAIELLKPGGHLMLIGIPRENRVSFVIDLMRRKELTLINVRRQNHCVQPAIDLIATGHAKVGFLITHHFRPEQCQPAFELVAHYRDGVLKAMVDF